jgi:hypothetical protein
MGIGAIGGGAAQRVQVEGQKTVVSRADLRGAIAKAYESQTGKKPTANVLDTLTAQASLETGSGSAMYNYNFGGIKGGAPGTNETAKLRTKEVYDGKEVEVRDGFRAYRSLDAGADDYVRLLRNKFGAAVERAEAGDINGFAHALKEAHYYTADESKYASALNTLAGKPDGATSSASALNAGTHGFVSNANISVGLGMSDAGGGFADSMDLSRIIGAIAQHPRRVEEDDE